MRSLLEEIRNCTICQANLPHGVNPILTAHYNSKIAIVGQAPGSVVHESGVPWDDKSGERLRSWLGVDKFEFYNEVLFALIPMGFCYPGKGKSGDLAPRKECAPQWHEPLFNQLRNLKLVLLIGSYAQDYYLKNLKENTLTETVLNYKAYLPGFLPLPHPSPRNNIWLKKIHGFKRILYRNYKKKLQKLNYLLLNETT